MSNGYCIRKRVNTMMEKIRQTLEILNVKNELIVLPINIISAKLYLYALFKLFNADIYLCY